MPSETTKADPSLMVDREKQNLELEIKEMISALTKRLSSLKHVHKPAGASSNSEEDEEDDHGTRIITLAGNNVGATMRGDLDGKPDHGDMSGGENEALSTYVNSNFQAINNSIMLGGKYSTNDPGVHMDITDYVEDSHKHGQKEKKKKMASSNKTDQQSEYSE